MPSKEYKLDIKEVLAAIDQNDFGYYSRLDEDQKKSLSFWTLMRFLSSCNKYQEHHLMMTNMFVNEGFNDLSKHPELQWKLLCICGLGSKQYHPWIAPPRKKGKNKIQAFLSSIYKSANSDELELLEQMYTKDELIKLAMDTGLTKQEAKKIF
jgi:hypothetical protein